MFYIAYLSTDVKLFSAEKPNEAWFLEEACNILRELIAIKGMTIDESRNDPMDIVHVDGVYRAEVSARLICCLMLSNAAKTARTHLGHLLFAHSAMLDVLTPTAFMNIYNDSWVNG
jgi:hypothetical protein